MILGENQNHAALCATVTMVVPKLDIHPDTLLQCPRLQKQANTPVMSELLDWRNIRKMEGEVCELHQPNELLHKISAYLRKEDSTTGSGHDTLHGWHRHIYRPFKRLNSAS